MIKLDTHPQIELIGPKTEVDTIEQIAVVRQLSLSSKLLEFKVGDEFEWSATLSGKVTLTEEHIGAARMRLFE
jgi:hypothetical protein